MTAEIKLGPKVHLGEDSLQVLYRLSKLNMRSPVLSIPNELSLSFEAGTVLPRNFNDLFRNKTARGYDPLYKKMLSPVENNNPIICYFL